MAFDRRGFIGAATAFIAGLFGSSTNMARVSQGKPKQDDKHEETELTTLRWDSVRKEWCYDDGSPAYDINPIYDMGRPEPIGFESVPFACSGVIPSFYTVANCGIHVGSGALASTSLTNICMCGDKAEKKYSKAGCEACWTCRKCGNFGGCDNRVFEPWEEPRTAFEQAYPKNHRQARLNS